MFETLHINYVYAMFLSLFQRYVEVMSKLLDKKYSYLLSEVEPELVPVGVPRTCFNLEEIKTLYGKMIYEMLYKTMYDFLYFSFCQFRAIWISS